jgi:hypothetical protein
MKMDYFLRNVLTIMTETYSYHFFAEVLLLGERLYCLDGIHTGPELTAHNYVDFKNNLRKEYQIEKSKDLVIRSITKL